MKRPSLRVVLIAVTLLNAFAALLAGGEWFAVTFSPLLGIVFSFELQDAIKTGQLETMQDGRLTFSGNPVRFTFVFLIFVQGYVVGLLGPWVLKTPAPNPSTPQVERAPSAVSPTAQGRLGDGWPRDR
jgi:hypothetical protein